MRLARAVLSATAVLFLSCSGTDEAAVREGDIVFQTSRSAQSQAIQLATGSPYSHMGLVLFKNGQPFVLEAADRVQLTPWQEWAANGEGGQFVVKRLRNRSALADPARLSALRKAALALEGKPYDLYFEWSDDRIYCSELVWKAFDRGLDIQIGSSVPLADFDLTSPLVKAKLAERYGDRVPLAEQVISPGAMFESPLLEEVR